jgi:hypothetical protein
MNKSNRKVFSEKAKLLGYTGYSPLSKDGQMTKAYQKFVIANMDKALPITDNVLLNPETKRFIANTPANRKKIMPATIPSGLFLNPVTQRLNKDTPANRKKIVKQTNMKHVRDIMNIELPIIDDEEPFGVKTSQKFKNAAETITITPKNYEKDYQVFVEKVRPTVYKKLKEVLNKTGPFKLVIGMTVKMIRISKGDDLVLNPIAEMRFHSGKLDNADNGANRRSRPIDSIRDIKKAFISATDEIEQHIADFIQNASDWVFVSVVDMDLKVAIYTAFGASSYLELPEWIKNKKMRDQYKK